MQYIRMTTDWNAEPNDPQVSLSINQNSLSLNFLVNAFLYTNFKEEDKVVLTFHKCHKFSFNNMNDEGYYMGLHRYKSDILPWGEFYLIETDWEKDFPDESTILIERPNKSSQNHYIFFFKDNTFECVAEGFHLNFLS